VWPWGELTFSQSKSAPCAKESAIVIRDEWPAHWEPQEEGMMSIAVVFPQLRNQGYVDQERKTDNATEGDAC
jgi:hypothetical protein